MHLWAAELEAAGDPVILQLRGAGRIFAGDLRLLAESLSWAPEAGLMTASGAVELAAPSWELKAAWLELWTRLGLVRARDLELRHRGLWLKAASAELSREVWLLHGVELRLDDSPLLLQAAEVRLIPAAHEANLVLEQVSLPGLPGAWPVLSLNLPGLITDSTELRPPLSVFQPELGLVAGGLRAGFSSELWRSDEQRLYGRLLADPQYGPLAEFSHEWRPGPDWLLHTQLGAGSAGFQGRAEGLWQTPLGPWLRGRARWQQPDSFVSEFWLPPLQPILSPASGFELWAASDWLEPLPQLRTRLLAGARWPQQQAGLTALAQLPLWQAEAWSLEGSLLLNGLTGLPVRADQGIDPMSFDATAGARLLGRYDIDPQWSVGGYLEQYLSTLPAGGFLQPERLSPWLAGFAFWRLNEDFGIGLEAALSLSSGRPVLADALISWRLRPFYVHLLLQGLPAGVQLQTRFEL